MQDLLFEFISHYGLSEAVGPKSNPEIIQMGKDIGFTILDDSTTAWCSLALNYYAKKCGYEHTDSPLARSWLKMPIVVLKPSPGDIAVFDRNVGGTVSNWAGHVGLFINWNQDYVFILGGNQSNGINISPYSRNRLLGFRRLRKLNEIRNGNYY